METQQMDPIVRLTRDLKVASTKLSQAEARYLVDSYYQLQEVRKASSNQVASIEGSEDPCEVLVWFRDNAKALESQIHRALGAYASGHRVGRWSQSIVGIGPVISAGLLAHIDLKPWRCVLHKMDPKEKACSEKEPHPGGNCSRQPIETVGHIWRYAGLDPTSEWKKGEKRPFNARLKVLCWKIGQSFVKFSNHEDCIYGKAFRERWEIEKQNNEAGKLAAQATAKLEKFNIGKSTDAYKAYSVGKLPPAHILQRACRWTTKLFLAHWHHVAWESAHGQSPVKPYVINQLGHTHYLAPPNWPCE